VGLCDFIASSWRATDEAIEQWSDDSKVALGLVNDWSTPNSPYIQVPEKMEPPIGFEPRCALLLRSPTVYETQGALNAFKRLGCLLTNRVR
jgi:hypothetical protein